MNSRTAAISRRARATAVAALTFAALIVAAPAHADTTGVQVDVGGAGGSGFVADPDSTEGRADTIPAGAPSFPNWGNTVAHPIPAAIWNTSRVGDCTYTLPGLTPGADYQVRLYFMDWYFTHAGQREFDVTIDGAKVLTDFDIIGAANARGADGAEAFGVEKDFPATADATGAVTVSFTRGSANQVQVNAISVVPAA